MSDTSFRTWMKGLSKDNGERAEWAILLRWMLEAEFQDQQKIDRRYTGKKILIDRTSHRFEDATVPEKRAVYGLFHHCQKESDGCLLIDDVPVWLLTYETPNQASSTGRRADLVGLTKDGGLVVFEGKLGKNSYPPISAVLEGLDYLSCLMSDSNFKKLILDFRELKKKLPVPEGFEKIEPKRSACPMVIVLADSVYFDFYDKSKRGPGWREMLKYGKRKTSVSIRFAIAKLDSKDSQKSFSTEVSWLT